MSVFRKYNKENKRWEPVASADATTIFSGNATITPNGETASIEDILIRDRADIDLLKKNVSWLAKHGGGGGWGGGSATKATVQILSPLDNTTPVNNIIWKSNIAYIPVKIVSTYNGTYKVSVRVNGKEVYKFNEIKRNTVFNIPASTLGMSQHNTGATLQILAYDEAEMEYTAECKLSIASVELQKPMALTVTQNELQNANPTIMLTYRTSIPGDYRMYYSDTSIYYDPLVGWRDAEGPLNSDSRSQYVDMLNVGTTVSNIGINVTDVYGDGSVSIINKNTAPGVYARYFVMVSATDPSINSPVQTAQINVTLTNGILIAPQFGIDENSPYSITMDGILDVKFIAYSSKTGTYQYTIYCDDIQLSETRTGNVYGTIVTEKIPVNKFADVRGVYTLTIRAEGLGAVATANMYIRTTEAATSLLTAYKQDINRYAIFDFTMWDDNMQDLDTSASSVNNDFEYGVTNASDPLVQNINIYNKGVDSKSTKVYYKMNHTCVAKIDSNNHKWFPENISDTSSIIPGPAYQFTLSMAYRIGPEVDDNATVFYMGNYKPISLGGNGAGSGILITAHGYYIRIEGTTIEGVLSDDNFTQLDIVMTPGKGVQSSYTFVYIYQNGILLQAAEVKINNEQGKSYSLYSFNDMCIACRSMENKGNYYSVSNNINMDLYSIKFYRIPLNDGQIVCNYINNYANYKRLSTDSTLDSELITKLLANNSINHDSEVPKDSDGKYDTSKISSLYNMNSGEYDWGVSIEGTDIQLGNNLQNIPIPIISISGLNWKYSEFTSTSSTALPTSGRLRYKDGNTEIVRNVEIAPQGTTTLNYDVKNIDITFLDCLFSPKSSWFPEQTFTCKADIVDSGHINNAMIGTFVNDCLNDASLIDPSAFPVKNIVTTYQNSGNIPRDMNIKATIEGFPVLLVLDFVSENGDGRDPRVLGIYSFNLGRKSYYNQGFRVLKCLRDMDGNVLNSDTMSFPNIFKIPGEQDIDKTYDAYCFEGERSFNSSVDEVPLESNTYDYAEIIVDKTHGETMWLPMVNKNSNGYVIYNDTIITDKNRAPIAWNANNVKKYAFNPDGYFWSNHASYASEKLWNLIYGENTNEANDAFKKLNECIATKLQYNKGSSARVYGIDTPQYEIVSNDGESVVRRKTANTFQMTYPQTKEPVEISVKNSAFYYVVCMLFGLIDNFGKNLQLKHWRPTNSDVQTQWSPTFYDMDTAVGIENTGGQNVPPTVFDESIINVPAASAEKVTFMYSKAPQSTNGIFTVYSNKLWGGLESPEFQRQYTTGYGGEDDYKIYSKMWSALRTSMLTSVDEFVSKYLNTQLNKCGEFLYNYDYNVKYLKTSQIDMLHGNRLSFIKNWLNERVAFLDSVFGCKADINSDSESNYLTETVNSQAPYIAPYNITWKNQVNVRHHSGSYNIPIKTNKSLVVRTIIGNKSTSYVYTEKNKTTNIPMSDSLNTQNIQTVINNSDSIIDIDFKPVNVYGIVGNQGIPVTDRNNQIYYAGKEALTNIYNQMGSLSSLKKLDLSNCNINAIDFFPLFKTWDSSTYGKMPEAFQLQEINLSKVTNPNLSVDLGGEKSMDEQIPEIYRSPFTNITSIDISDSNISSITIPKGVSLYNLKVNNSTIRSLSLIDQPLLASPNISGCLNLEEVTYVNCNRFDTVVFDPTLHAITRIDISDCMNLEEITINGDEYEFIPSVAIQNCPKLKRINITKCNGKVYKNASGSGSDVIKLADVPDLESIIVTDSYYTKIVWDGAEKLQALSIFNISNTTIGQVLVHDDESNPENIIDLRGFGSDVLKVVNLSSNAAFKDVYFSNIKDKPFVINTNNAFSRCSNLERVYGNIYINTSGVFMGCKKFSIHGNGGGIYSNITYVTEIQESVVDDVPYNPSNISIPVWDNGRWRHPSEMGILTDEGVIWQPGSNVTNMRLSNTDALSQSRANCFNGTACTVFDVYYILQNTDPGVTGVTGLFQGASDHVRFEWTENYDNSPHREMFSRCGNMINMNNMLSGTIKFCRIYTPYTDEDEVYHMGLFTPLASVGNMDAIFGDTSNAVTDRHIFERETPFESLYNITNFSPYVFVENVNTIEYSDIDLILKDPITNKHLHGNIDGLFSNCPRLGDMQTTSKENGTLQNVLNNVLYIDYNKLTNLGLPTSVTGLCHVLKSKYADGIMDIKTMFNMNEDGAYNLKNIYSSFVVNERNENLSCEFILDNDTFKGFTSLGNIGYNYLNIRNTGGYSFSGNGLTKKLKNNTFPYDMLGNMPELEYFIGFFNKCEFNVSNVDDIELPGGLFMRNTKLKDVSYCFYDIKTNVPVKLSTNAPFQNCHGLSNVKYMFGISDNNYNKSALRKGQIPARFFYHGDKAQTLITLVGTDHEEQVTVEKFKNTALGPVAVRTISSDTVGNVTTVVTYEYNKYDETETENIILVTPVTTINEVTTVTDNTSQPPKVTTTSTPIQRDLDSYTKTYEFEYTAPNTSITNMEGCFTGADFIPYQMTWDVNKIVLPETNPDYQPFKYVYRNGSWVKAEQNLYRYTYMWMYDGGRLKYYNYITNEAVVDKINSVYTPVEGYEYKMYLPDDAYVDGYDSIDEMISNVPADIKKPGSVYGLSATYVTDSDNFCCAPDLLRYCDPSANITRLFKNCGLDTHVYSKSNRYNIFDTGTSDLEKSYGLKGRLCPYLLKPLTSLGDLTDVFNSCSFLGGYVKRVNNTDHVYIIPESFLQYTKSPSLNLTRTFKSWTWPLKSDINVFNFKNNMTLNIESAFETPLFTQYDYSGQSNSNAKTELINTFISDNIMVRGMKNCFMVSTSSTSEKYIINQPVTFSNIFKTYDSTVLNADYYVFAGYTRIGGNPETNERFGVKTLSQLVNRHNYTANDEW